MCICFTVAILPDIGVKFNFLPKKLRDDVFLRSTDGFLVCSVYVRGFNWRCKYQDNAKIYLKKIYCIGVQHGYGEN